MMAVIPAPPFSPATKTSRQATPSGYGNCSSTMNTLRNVIVNIVPRIPPNTAIINVSSNLISIPITRRAGTVKITPAANDSPALAIV